MPGGMADAVKLLTPAWFGVEAWFVEGELSGADVEGGCCWGFCAEGVDFDACPILEEAADSGGMFMNGGGGNDWLNTWLKILFKKIQILK